MTALHHMRANLPIHMILDSIIWRLDSQGESIREGNLHQTRSLIQLGRILEGIDQKVTEVQQAQERLEQKAFQLAMGLTEVQQNQERLEETVHVIQQDVYRSWGSILQTVASVPYDSDTQWDKLQQIENRLKTVEFHCQEIKAGVNSLHSMD